MSHTLRTQRLPAFLALVLLSLTAVCARAQTTLDNLLAAYGGEMNAHTRYLAFSRQAEREGYGQIASLFRAAARAEFVHAENHAAVIRQMGGKPVATVESPTVGSTAENLKAAIDGESYERDKMYPQFIEQARTDRARDAVRSFNYARTAEASHAKFYQEALDNLDRWRGDKKDFYVCEVCGETLTELPEEKCPSCFQSRDEYRLVN